MDAIVLAGGFGTRLRSVVGDVPKPMAEIGGRPFLAFLLDYITALDVDRIILSVGYRHDVIEEYIGSIYKGTPVEYVIEPYPLGTGGALRECLAHINGDRCLAFNGDTFFVLDMGEMMRFHLMSGSALTIAVKPMKKSNRYGTIRIQDGRVTGFEEKSCGDIGNVNGGIYIMEKLIYDAMKTCGSAFSFEKDFLAPKIRDIRAFAYMSDTYFIDIGIPEDYRKAQRELPELTGTVKE